MAEWNFHGQIGGHHCLSMRRDGQAVGSIQIKPGGLFRATRWKVSTLRKTVNEKLNFRMTVHHGDKKKQTPFGFTKTLRFFRTNM